MRPELGALAKGVDTLNTDEQLKRVLKRRESFLNGYTQCVALLDQGNVQEAIPVWETARSAYMRMRELEQNLDTELEDSQQLSAQFFAMAEKMRPYLQAEPNS